MAFQDNVKRNVQQTDVGFKISKPGYNVNRSAGSNLVFSSSWPSLPIAFEKTITNPITSSAATGMVPHNLGFPALTFTWLYGTDPSGVGNVVRRITAVSSVDNNNVYLSPIGTTVIDTDFLYSATKLHIKCFQLDLSIDEDYILAPGDTYKSPYDPNFGVKVVKQFKDINSRDLRDFAIHSRAQSPLILAVKTEATASPANPLTVQYTNLTQTWVYGYVRHTNGRYQYAPYGGQAYPITHTDGLVTNLTSNNIDPGVTVVVLRDPMFSSTKTTVQY